MNAEEIIRRNTEGQDPTLTPAEQIIQQRTTPAPQIDETSWMEALGGLNPVGGTLYKSFGKEAWNTIKGVPMLPSIMWQLTKEMGSGKTGYVSPQMSQRAQEMGLQLTQSGGISRMSQPLLHAIMDDYAARFGSAEGFKKTLAENPFEILSELLPLLSKAGKAGKLGKYSKYIEKGADVADPSNLPGTAVAGGLDAFSKTTAPYFNQYNPDVTSQFGRNQRTGQPETTTLPVDHLAHKYGAGAEETPAMVLSDARGVQILSLIHI